MNGLKKLENLIHRLQEYALITPDEVETCEKSFLWIESNLKNKSDYIEYLEKFNEITKKKYIPSLETRKLYYEHANYYSLADRLQALRNAITASWFDDKQHLIKPDFMLKSDVIGQYINYKESEKKIKVTNKTNEKGYANI